MPAAASSKAVRRAPCSSGRVSSANTRSGRPCSCARYIGAVAVPMPPVASAPALQWVSTAGVGWDASRLLAPASSHRQAARSSGSACSPMARHIAASSSWIRFASASSASGVRSPAAYSRFMRSIAQKRLTAVGRLVARWLAASSKVSCCAPMTQPNAAATPIAGAPRTLSRLIASQTHCTSWQSM